MREETSPERKREWTMGPILYAKPLKLKCLFCKKIDTRPCVGTCKVFPDRQGKPDNIYFDNAPCPHFERTTNEQAIYWLHWYLEDLATPYIPREDDTPPEGWEQLNEQYFGKDWRSKLR